VVSVNRLGGLENDAVSCHCSSIDVWPNDWVARLVTDGRTFFRLSPKIDEPENGRETLAPFPRAQRL
jgi:hypothetical protein